MQQLDEFFNRYEQRVNDVLQGVTPHVDGVVNSFAKFFIESSPAGVISGANDQAFREKIPQGYGMYREIGIKSMRILSKHLSKLDDFHVMANILWRSDYGKNEKNGSIDFEVIYLLTKADGDLKIFCYITGDEQKALRDHQLI